MHQGCHHWNQMILSHMNQLLLGLSLMKQKMHINKTIIDATFQQKYLHLKPRNIKESTLVLKEQTYISNGRHLNDQRNTLTPLSIKELFDLIYLTNSNPHFLPILAFNADVQPHLLFVQKILTPRSLLSLTQLIQIVKNDVSLISQELIQLFIKQGLQLLELYQEGLSNVDQQSYDLSIIKNKANYQIVIQFHYIRFSYQDQQNNPSSHHQKIAFLRQTISNHLPLPHSSISETLYRSLQKQERSLNTSRSKLQDMAYNFGLINSLYSKFLHNTYDFIHASISGLTSVIYNNKLFNHRDYKSDVIRMKDTSSDDYYKGQIYHNLGCQHYEGISYQTYSQLQYCPMCNNQLFFDQQYVHIYCQNIFQMLLRHNYFNQNNHPFIEYNFTNKTFLPKSMQQTTGISSFQDYHSFKTYLQRYNTIDIKTISIYPKYQSVSLYNRLNGKKEFFHGYELIDCPVRGKYCHHWQFYDLILAYNQMMINAEKQEFDCPVCCKNIKISEILYLQQVKMVIDLVRDNCYMKLEDKMACKIFFNHEQQRLAIQYKGEQEQKASECSLNIYQTFKDSKCKSRYMAEWFWQNKLSVRKQFIDFFYGLSVVR